MCSRQVLKPRPRRLEKALGAAHVRPLTADPACAVATAADARPAAAPSGVTHRSRKRRTARLDSMSAMTLSAIPRGARTTRHPTSARSTIVSASSSARQPAHLARCPASRARAPASSRPSSSS